MISEDHLQFPYCMVLQPIHTAAIINLVDFTTPATFSLRSGTYFTLGQPMIASMIAQSSNSRDVSLVGGFKGNDSQILDRGGGARWCGGSGAGSGGGSPQLR